MMYLHYCKRCQRIHLLNGHKMFCPKCDSKLSELRISYLDYVEMDREKRETLRLDCQDEQSLAKLTTNYRMYKYSKWYKKLQESNNTTTDTTALATNHTSSSNHADHT